MRSENRQNRSIRFESFIPFVIPVFVLAVWELAVRTGAVKPLFFPPPSLILQTFVRMIGSGELQRDLFPTLGRIFMGFAIGAVPGLILGLSMGWSPKIRLVLDPIISALYPVPKIAILPLIMLVLGIGEISKLTVIGIGSFFLISINSMAGVRNIDKIYFEVAENNGASKLQVFTCVVLPGSLPMIFAGIRLALGMSLLLVVAVEFNTANEGLGVMIWLAWETLRTEILYVGVIICAILGLIFNVVLKRVEKCLIPWEETFLRRA